MNRLLPNAHVLCTSACLLTLSCISAASDPAAEACKGISTIQQLSDIRKNLAGCYFLTKNLDGKNFSGFKPIGDNLHPLTNPFRGSLDGRGFSIRNLRIIWNTQPNGPTTAEAGLFMSIAQVGPKKGVVRNLHLVNMDVRWIGNGSGTVGVLAAIMRGDTLVTNVTATGFARGNDSSYVGGLIGDKRGGTLSKCETNVKVIGTDFVQAGGVLGRHSGGTVRECGAKGPVTAGDGSDAAGFTGININKNTKIFESFSLGAVKTGDSSVAAGFTTLNDGTLQHVYSRSPVTVGGGFGVSLAALVTFANETSRIIQGYATGKVQTTATFPTNIGGLIGFAAPDDRVTSGYWDTQSTGQAESDGGTPMTTAQLKGGGLPPGFSGAIWGKKPNQYPHLKKIPEN